MKISSQPSHQGIVVFTRFDGDDKGYGFIEPAGSDGDVFFNTWATQGRSDFERGTEVSYVLSTQQRDPDKGPAAYRVWKRTPSDDASAVTTLNGEFDT